MKISLVGPLQGPPSCEAPRQPTICPTIYIYLPPLAGIQTRDPTTNLDFRKNLCSRPLGYDPAFARSKFVMQMFRYSDPHCTTQICRKDPDF